MTYIPRPTYNYRVTCDEHCYDLASWWLEDDVYRGLFNHDNCNELGGVIQKAIDEWVADKKANYTPETT